MDTVYGVSYGSYDTPSGMLTTNSTMFCTETDAFEEAKRMASDRLNEEISIDRNQPLAITADPNRKVVTLSYDGLERDWWVVTEFKVV